MLKKAWSCKSAGLLSSFMPKRLRKKIFLQGVSYKKRYSLSMRVKRHVCDLLVYILKINFKFSLNEEIIFFDA